MEKKNEKKWFIIQETTVNKQNVDRIERGQLVFILESIRVGGEPEGNTLVGVSVAPVYRPTEPPVISISVALPSPPMRFPKRWSLVNEVGKVRPVVVGVSDSGTTRLLPSYRLLLFINGELASPSFTFTYARLAITLNDARAIS